MQSCVFGAAKEILLCVQAAQSVPTFGENHIYSI